MRHTCGMYVANGIDGERGKSTPSSGTRSPAAIVGYREGGGSISPRTQASRSSSSARNTHRCSAKFRYCAKSEPNGPLLGGNDPLECGVPARKYSPDVGPGGMSLRASSLV